MVGLFNIESAENDLEFPLTWPTDPVLILKVEKYANPGFSLPEGIQFKSSVIQIASICLHACAGLLTTIFRST